ncbi:unnamed protein product [Adineta steineri]|uniref:Ig-like domain-containing protein n=1 Tax=Adineta steineri TaxID=433720 RepID=A0A815GIR8_9BILA|nr:unnamed protein product [Adineta steineri]CAF3502827.1 unnamed protein product [Adineta steineri]
MATQKVNKDRLFLTRLSEIYKCRSGDNVLLECYLRYQRIKSIAWYAKGEHVDTRGVRIWYQYVPTTGQCILYIRSVNYGDEGSYCCQATSIDNVVETLEIKIKIDNSDKTWTKIPILHMAGRVMPGGKKFLFI